MYEQRVPEGKTPRRRGLWKEAHHHQLHSQGPLQDSLTASDLKKMPAEILVVKGECVRGQLSNLPKEGYGMDDSPNPAPQLPVGS